MGGVQRGTYGTRFKESSRNAGSGMMRAECQAVGKTSTTTFTDTFITTSKESPETRRTSI